MPNHLMLIVSANDHVKLNKMIVENKKINITYTKNDSSLLSRAVICKARECFDILLDQINQIDPMPKGWQPFLNADQVIIEYSHINPDTLDFEYYLIKILEQPWFDQINIFYNIGLNPTLIYKMVQTMGGKSDCEKLIKIFCELIKNEYLEDSFDQLKFTYQLILDYIWKDWVEPNEIIKMIPFTIDEYDETICDPNLYHYKQIKYSIQKMKNYLNECVGNHSQFVMFARKDLGINSVSILTEMDPILKLVIIQKNYSMIELIGSKMNILLYHCNCGDYYGTKEYSFARPSIHPTIYLALVLQPDMVNYFLPYYTPLSIQELNSIPNIKTLFYVLDSFYMDDFFSKDFSKNPTKYFNGLRLIFGLPIEFDYEYIFLGLIDGFFRTNYHQIPNSMLFLWLVQSYPDLFSVDKIITEPIERKLITALKKSFLQGDPTNAHQLLYILEYFNFNPSDQFTNSIDKFKPEPSIWLKSKTEYITLLIQKITPESEPDPVPNKLSKTKKSSKKN
jgi:hypothetical protein